MVFETDWNPKKRIVASPERVMQLKSWIVTPAERTAMEAKLCKPSRFPQCRPVWIFIHYRFLPCQ
jgi:hypothetical protein